MSFNNENILHENTIIDVVYNLQEIDITGPIGPTGPTGPTGPIGPTGPVNSVQFPTAGDLTVSPVNNQVYTPNNQTVVAISTQQLISISDNPLFGFNGNANYGRSLPTFLNLNATCTISGGICVFGVNERINPDKGIFEFLFGFAHYLWYPSESHHLPP